MEPVIFNTNEHSLIITLNNEKQRNCLSPLMMKQFAEIVKKQITNNTRFVYIQANGAHFCAGADLEWMRKQKDNSMLENYSDSIQLQNFFETIYNIPVPVVSYVQGGVYGGGVGLVAACDYVVVDPGATFCLSEVRLGLVPAVISPFVIQKIGMSWFSALSLTAKNVDASFAFNMGLVHQIADENLKQASSGEKYNYFSKIFGALSPQATRENKKMIRKLTDPFVLNKEVQNNNRATITKLRASQEGIEGMSALLEKRNPSWLIKA
jgi:methylglutaconyl-CoA hydratase